MQITEIQKTIGIILNKVAQQRKAGDYYGLITSGIASLEYSYYLIEPMIQAESEYRKLEASEITNGSLGRAETIAKASEHYKDWQKARYLHDTLLEINMSCKKLSSSNDKELKAN